MEAIKQHQKLARGMALDTGNFGVSSAWKSNGNEDQATARKRLRDHERGAGDPVRDGDGMKGQADPDHGPAY